jgi:hypothetical protein
MTPKADSAIASPSRLRDADDRLLSEDPFVAPSVAPEVDRGMVLAHRRSQFRYGAAKESNLPSGGLLRPAGFEDRMGHQAHATPSASLERQKRTSAWPIWVRGQSRPVGDRRLPPRNTGAILDLLVGC